MGRDAKGKQAEGRLIHLALSLGPVRPTCPAGDVRRPLRERGNIP